MWPILRGTLAAWIVVLSFVQLVSPDRGLTRAGQLGGGQTIPHPPICGSTITDLGTLGGRSSFATHINNAGLIAGIAETAAAERHVVLWDKGEVTDLTTQGPLPPGDSRVQDISSAGEVVVATATGAVGSRSFLWREGVLIDLGSLGGAAIDATDMNDAGQVVGTATLANGDRRAFVWEDGVMTQLSTLGGAWSGATKINERGQIVGVSTTSGGERHACLWQGGAITDLGAQLGGGSSALDINDRGQVLVQQGWLAMGNMRMFTWEAGVMTELTVPGSDGQVFAMNNDGLVIGRYYAGGWEHTVQWKNAVPIELGTLGGSWSYPFALNEHGEVAGYSETADRSYSAFLWSDGIMIDLGSLGGGHGIANALNDAGQAVGQADTKDELTHAVVWNLSADGTCSHLYLPQLWP